MRSAQPRSANSIPPLKFAELLIFGRANRPGIGRFSLVEPRRRIKTARRQRSITREPAGQTFFGRHSFAYFSAAEGRKVSRHKGETKCIGISKCLKENKS